MNRYLFAVLLIAVACRKDEVPEVDLGKGYFPTQVGSWVEFEVDSMWRDDPAAVLDSVRYRVIERIAEAFTDGEGRDCRILHRLVKDASGDWVIRDVWSQCITDLAVERTEENQRRLKLSFPVRDGRVWDINIYNTVPELKVSYDEVDVAWATDSLSFERTVLVKNTEPPNFVERRDFEERYADGVGLVWKRWEETNTQTTFPAPTPTNPSPPPIISVVGWRLEMEVVAYGQSQ